jgi:hypothetical protein
MSAPSCVPCWWGTRTGQRCGAHSAQRHARAYLTNSECARKSRCGRPRRIGAIGRCGTTGRLGRMEGLSRKTSVHSKGRSDRVARQETKSSARNFPMTCAFAALGRAHQPAAQSGGTASHTSPPRKFWCRAVFSPRPAGELSQMKPRAMPRVSGAIHHTRPNGPKVRSRESSMIE